MKNEKIELFDLAIMNRCLINEVNCKYCRLRLTGSINHDTNTCRCTLWDQRMLCSSFCSYFSKMKEGDNNDI